MYEALYRDVHISLRIYYTTTLKQNPQFGQKTQLLAILSLAIIQNGLDFTSSFAFFRSSTSKNGEHVLEMARILLI